MGVHPIHLNGVFECIFVFDSCEELTIFCTDNILLETAVHWLSEDVISLEIEVGVYENFAKNVTVFSGGNHATFTPG